jgi:DNA (cytosine-5)-methyltransferase 1
MKKRADISIAAIDLFCGAGGLTKGLENAGIKVKLGIDIDPACTFPYETNTNADFLLKPVEDIEPEQIRIAFGSAPFTLLAGCAPCQPFSKYRLGKSDSTDSRWHLLKAFQKIVLATAPTLVTMENVPRLAEQRIFRAFVKALKESGYNVTWSVVNCADYGVPQTRARLVLIASKLGAISLIPPTHTPDNYKTVRAAIGRLPRIRAGQIYENDHLHQASCLSPKNLKRIKSSAPGGTWRDWEPDLVAACHRKASGKTYPGVYGRMCWDEPAPTMTTQFFGFGNGRFGHPQQNRAISLREGAILQSFPRGYRFAKPGSPIYRKQVGRLIGNAVPVKLAEAIGRSVVEHVKAQGVCPTRNKGTSP